MANPRFAVDYTGIDNLRVSFKIDASTITYDGTLPGGSASVGLAVHLKAATADVVELCADADAVLGRLEDVQADGICTVTVDGFIQLPGGSGATLTHGFGIVGALGAASAKGYIREAVAAESPKMHGEIINSLTATAVWVNL